MASFPYLTFLVFFPLVAAALIALLPRSAERSARLWATLAAAFEFVVSLPLWWRVIPGSPGFQFFTSFAINCSGRNQPGPRRGSSRRMLKKT